MKMIHFSCPTNYDQRGENNPKGEPNKVFLT